MSSKTNQDRLSAEVSSRLKEALNLPELKQTRLSQEARSLLKEAFDLPEEERIAVFGALRSDLIDQLAPSTAENLNYQRQQAIEAFNTAAEHLGKDHEDLKRRMKMREFDSLPSRKRNGATARQVARVFLNSWPLARAAAVGDILPVDVLTYRKRQSLAGQEKVFARHQTGLDAWLESEPDDLTQAAYDRWRTERNKNLKEGAKPFVAAKTIRERWGKSWDELIEEARAGSLVAEPVIGDDPEEILRAKYEPGDSKGNPSAVVTASPGDFAFGSTLLARRLQAARTARGYSKKKLAEISGVSGSVISKLELGKVTANISFDSILKLANALDVTVDYFATPDGGRGIPGARRKRAKPKKTRKKAKSKPHSRAKTR